MALFPTTALRSGRARCRPAVFAREAPSRIDDAAIAAVTDLYREILPPGGAILDRDVGLGQRICRPKSPIAASSASASMRRALAENPFLDEWRVQDLNRDPGLPFAAGEFDGATICVAIQHLDAARRGDPRDRARAAAGRAADRDLLEPMSGDARRSPAGACSTMPGISASSPSISPRPATGPTSAASTARRPAAASRSMR